MSKCPQRGATLLTVMSYECGSRRLLGGLFNQSDYCVIRELRQQVGELAAAMRVINSNAMNLLAKLGLDKESEDRK